MSRFRYSLFKTVIISWLFFTVPVAKAQVLQAVKPEVAAIIDGAVGNISFDAGGNLIYSYHPFFDPAIRVARYDKKTHKIAPFPNKRWNTVQRTNDHYLSNVLGIRNDGKGVVWMLDMGQRTRVIPKIVGWNTNTNQLEHIYYLPSHALSHFSQPNDMLIDTKHRVFIIADEGIGNGGDGSEAALILVDMRNGSSRRLLQGTRSTAPENIPTVIGRKTLQVNGRDLLVGCDGITADKDFNWLYYAPLNGSKIYRLKIANLVNEELSPNDLERMVEVYADKPNNGGLSIDSAGNLYLTVMESGSIDVILAKDRSIHHLIHDDRLQWPDGVSYNEKDGYMYVSAAQVHLGAVFNGGTSKAKAPYFIFRFKPLVPGVPYR